MVSRKIFFIQSFVCQINFIIFLLTYLQILLIITKIKHQILLILLLRMMGALEHLDELMVIVVVLLMHNWLICNFELSEYKCHAWVQNIQPIICDKPFSINILKLLAIFSFRFGTLIVFFECYKYQLE